VSFDDDIIEDVYHQFEGRYSRQLIRRILDCSVNRFRQMERFSDKLALYIPGTGYLVADRTAMNQRLQKLRRRERAGKLTAHERTEMQALEIKLEKMRQIKAAGEGRHVFFRGTGRLLRQLFTCPESEQQDFQDRLKL
jgi:hypothetical protein